MSYVVSNKTGELCDLLWNMEDFTDVLAPGAYKNQFLNLLFNFGLYKSVNTKLRDILPTNIDYSRCTAVCTALPSLQDIWFTGNDFPEGIIASSSIPLLFEPYIINRAKCMGGKNLHNMSWYVDGSLSEYVPISTLWDDKTHQLTDNGFDGVYIVLRASNNNVSFIPQMVTNRQSIENFCAALPPNRICTVNVGQYLSNASLPDSYFSNIFPNQQLIRDYIRTGSRIANEVLHTRGKELGFS